MDVSREYYCWVIAKPCDDVPGEWIAHNLELDVISQGTTARHAIEMVSEASCLTVIDDIQKGFDPATRQAPRECFDDMFEIVNKGVKVQESDIDLPAPDVAAFAVQMRLVVTLEFKAAEEEEPTQVAPVVRKPAPRPKRVELPLSYSSFRSQRLIERCV